MQYIKKYNSKKRYKTVNVIHKEIQDKEAIQNSKCNT